MIRTARIGSYLAKRETAQSTPNVLLLVAFKTVAISGPTGLAARQIPKMLTGACQGQVSRHLLAA